MLRFLLLGLLFAREGGLSDGSSLDQPSWQLWGGKSQQDGDNKTAVVGGNTTASQDSSADQDNSSLSQTGTFSWDDSNNAFNMSTVSVEASNSSAWSGEDKASNSSTPGLDSLGGGLSGGPQPGEGDLQRDRKQSKRQFFLQPLQQQQPFPFVPVYIPYQQVVHHVVMLQPPACVPAGYPQPLPGTYPQALPGGYPQPQVQPGGYPQPWTYPQQPYPQPTPSPLPQPGPNQVPQMPPSYLPPTQPPTQPPTTTSTMDPGIDDRAGPMMGGRETNSTRRPSRCVWAIVACCSPDSTNIRYSCFELLGCPGAFWGVNPCEQKVVQAAANTALNFYMTGEPNDSDFDGNRV